MKILKNLILSLSILFLISQISNAQNVGIGITTPDASAMLDVESTTKGILIPRMLQTERNGITTPATGLFIYQTDSPIGFYYYKRAVTGFY